MKLQSFKAELSILATSPGELEEILILLDDTIRTMREELLCSFPENLLDAEVEPLTFDVTEDCTITLEIK